MNSPWLPLSRLKISIDRIFQLREFFKMKFLFLFFGAFCDGARNISDAEYQNFYSGVVDVAEIYGFDRFQFRSEVSLFTVSLFKVSFHKT